MQYKLISKDLTVIINARGAEVSSIKNARGFEYLWPAKPQIWPRHAPVLFPIVGKLKDNHFNYQQQSYSLTQHGFARDMEFKLIKQDEDSCELELRSTEQTKTNYPFDFIFRILYKLHGNKLSTTYHIINPSKNSLYFSVGAHPGFNCPLHASENFEDYYLEFERDVLQRTELLDGLRLQSKTELRLENGRLPISSALFDKDALVFENNQINHIHLGSKHSGRILSMSCEGWPYFGIWTKTDCREFICLEPWYGIADAQNSKQELLDKDGIIQLEAAGEFKCEFSVSIL